MLGRLIVCLKVCQQNHQLPRELFTLILVYKESDIDQIQKIKNQVTRKRILWLGQDILPAFDDQGRIVLQQRNKLMVEPTGLGGVVRSMISSSITDCLAQIGITLQVSHFYFYSGTNLRLDVFDMDLFARAITMDICAKVYKIDPTQYKDALQSGDAMSVITLEPNGEKRLFCSEIVFVANFFDKNSPFAEINIAETYRIKKRTLRVFDYVNMIETIKEAKYFNLTIPDLIAAQRVGFYDVDGQMFDLLTTHSELIRLEVKSSI